MPALRLTDEQLLTLRAAWQYLLEDQEAMSSIGEALGIDDEDRGVDEDGEYTAEDGEANDPLVKRMGEVTTLIMTD